MLINLLSFFFGFSFIFTYFFMDWFHREMGRIERAEKFRECLKGMVKAYGALIIILYPFPVLFAIFYMRSELDALAYMVGTGLAFFAGIFLLALGKMRNV